MVVDASTHGKGHQTFNENSFSHECVSNTQIYILLAHKVHTLQCDKDKRSVQENSLVVSVYVFFS